MKITILGSGTSHGVPVIACTCPVCTSKDPKDTRYRSSIFIEGDNGEHILIDAGPEMRLQILRAGITRLDALFITHSHADHVHGIDDVRPLTKNKTLPVYASSLDVKELHKRFSYVFCNTQKGGGKPKFNLIPITEKKSIHVGSLSVLPIPMLHGSRPVFGYRIGNMAYLTDCSFLPERAKLRLQGLDLLIIDGLRQRAHPTHFNFDQALEIASQLHVKRVYLTHLCHDFTHQQVEEYCKNKNLNFEAHPAFDCLKLSL